VDALDRLSLLPFVAVAESGDDVQPLLPRELAGLDHVAQAGAVDRDRLLDEGLLAGLDAGPEVERPEGRRRAAQAGVARPDHVLVGVEPDELLAVRHLHPPPPPLSPPSP